MTTNQRLNRAYLAPSAAYIIAGTCLFFGALFSPNLQTAYADTIQAHPIPDFFDYLTETQRQSLSTHGSIIQFDDSSKTLLAPQMTIPESQEPHRRDIYIETLHYFPFQGEDKSNSALAKHLYSILIDVESMQGIQYYSDSRDAMRVLFTQSYFIRSPEQAVRTTHTVENYIPAYRRFWLFQEDQTFGKNIYLMESFYDDHSIHIRMQNEENVGYGIIPAIRRHNMTIHLTVHPLVDGIVVFSSIRALPTFSLGLESRIRTSLENRLAAITDWFLDKLQENDLSGTN